MKLCSPQLEKGHTRVANELLEAIIAYPFTMAQLKVLFVVIRKTYGWRKKKSPISYGVITYLTGLNKRYVKRVIEKLVKDRVLLKEKDDVRNILGLNKNYSQWSLWITLQGGGSEDTSKVSSKTPGSGSQDTTKGGSQATTQKKERNIYKESSKEKGHLFTTSLKKENFREYLKEPIHIGKLIE